MKSTVSHGSVMSFQVTVDRGNRLVTPEVRGVLQGGKTAEMGKACGLKAKELTLSRANQGGLTRALRDRESAVKWLAGIGES